VYKYLEIVHLFMYICVHNQKNMTQDLKKASAKRIKELQRNVTGQDKTEACATLRISRPTLDKYLKGDISKVDTAISIVEFFEHKIKERITRLSEVA
jgi:hypothetical protein